MLLGKIREDVAICELKEGMALEEFVAGASESDISLARPLLSLLTAESSLATISLVITYQHRFGSPSVFLVYVQDLSSILIISYRHHSLILSIAEDRRDYSPSL